MSRFSFVLTALCGIGGLVMMVNLWLDAAPAQAQQPEEVSARLSAIKEACHKDYERLCSGVLPGGHRIITCLRSHPAELSPDCAQRLADIKTLPENSAGAVELPLK